jgi:hypothetical protein
MIKTKAAQVFRGFSAGENLSTEEAHKACLAGVFRQALYTKVEIYDPSNLDPPATLATLLKNVRSDPDM